LVGFHLGPIFAIAQTVAKPSMRVQRIAYGLGAEVIFQRVGRGTPYVIYITIPWRKTGQKPSE
jgi:hypothetical protein